MTIERLADDLMIAKFGRTSATEELDHPIVKQEREIALEMAKWLVQNGWAKNDDQTKPARFAYDG